MKSINLPLFWKFAFTIVLVVLVFGTVNLFILWKSVYQSFEKEIDKRCIVLSSILSEKALNPIVYDDVVSLYNVLGEMEHSDASIAYLFILDKDGHVIAKTIDSDIPHMLLSANSIKDGSYHIEVLNIKNYKYQTVRDIAYPILKGDVGTVRLGLVEDTIRDEIKEATWSLLQMILLFLAIGLLGAFGFSYLITSPIKTISQQAQLVNFNSINSNIDVIHQPRYKKLFSLYFSDELDLLVSKFSEMLLRLKDNYSELQKTRDSFVQAEKMAAIGTLAAGIGHEINNPISGIKNCVLRIAKKPENLEQTKKYIILIQDAADKIEDVTRHLLDFSRKEETIFALINPTVILENSISLIAFKAKKAEVIIQKDFQKGLAIMGSANHLEQVILNLLLNSIDAITERKAQDSELDGILIVRSFKKKDTICIEVEDNGAGIPDELKNKLYDPFFTSKKAGQGTGLGLYVSFNIIKEHQGKMYFESEAGKGTKFIIELKDTIE